MPFDDTKPTPPRHLGALIERVESVLGAAGAAGIVNGVLLAEAFVDVRLTRPYTGDFVTLTDAIRDVLGEGVQVTVRFEPAIFHAPPLATAVLADPSRTGFDA